MNTSNPLFLEQILTVSNSKNLQLLAAAALGLTLLVGVGFAPMDVAHNAAHDTRHSVAFPCH